MYTKLGTLLVSAILIWGSAVQAEKAERGLYNYNSLGVAYNPLGAIVENRLCWRVPLSSRPGILWESAMLEVGACNSWTPADEVFGVRVAYEPIAFFRLTGFGGYFGLFKGLGYGYYPFTSANASIGADLPKDVTRQNASGVWLSLAPELKMQVGRFICTDKLTVNHIELNRDDYYIELRSYSLQSSKDTHFVNEFMAGLEINPRVIAGATYRYLAVSGTGVRSHLVGGLAVVLFPKSRLGSAFVAVNPGYYVADPALKGLVYIGAMAGMDLKIR
jgi:hypothetical protein